MHPFITGEDLITPLQSDYYGVGLISDNFRNYFEKFVEWGFSEKSRSDLSTSEPIQAPLFSCARGQQIDINNNENSINSPKENQNRIGKSYANGKLKHLWSYTSLNSSAPLHGVQEHHSQNDEEQLFDNAEGIGSVESSIQVRVIGGGRVQNKRTERVTALDKKPLNKYSRKTITVYESNIDKYYDHNIYPGLTYGKHLKDDLINHSPNKWDDNKDAASTNTTKELMKESTFDEASSSKIKQHNDDVEIGEDIINWKLKINLCFRINWGSEWIK